MLPQHRQWHCARATWRGSAYLAVEAAAAGAPLVVSEDPALSAAAPASALRAASWDVESWVTAVRTVLAQGSDGEARVPDRCGDGPTLPRKP